LEEIGGLAEQAGVAAFVVGGLVRDLLLGHKNLDVDITVEGDGMAFACLLADHYKGGLKIFERFATAYVVFPNRIKFDIANTRAEQPAHPRPDAAGGWDIAAGPYCPIEQDLMRRDFTINALAIHLNARRFGRLLDPSGGLRDLRMRTIRAVYASSFADDPTRVFRAVRFERRFGFRIETKTLRLLKDTVAAGLVHNLPGHRVKNELLLLLAEPDPLRTIRRMASFNLLQPIHSGLTLTPRTETLLKSLAKALTWWERQFPNRTLDRPLIYFMALIEKFSGPTANAFMTRLVLPAGQVEKVRTVKLRLGPVLRRASKSRPLKPSETYRLLIGLPDEGLTLLVAHIPSREVKQVVSAYLTTYQPTKLTLSGKNLAAMGLQSGPVYKTVLDKLLNAKLDGQITTEREERDMAQQLVKKMAG
jgi:tRNA nucleotidyltransferase (CCA-adding enzyme)